MIAIITICFNLILLEKNMLIEKFGICVAVAHKIDNTDADAPIFQRARYGIVGDYKKIIPALTEKFEELLQN